MKNQDYTHVDKYWVEKGGLRSRKSILAENDPRVVMLEEEGVGCEVDATEYIASVSHR
jgi:hypothetical protein